VLPKERIVMQDKKRMYLTISLGLQNFSSRRLLSGTIFQVNAKLEEEQFFQFFSSKLRIVLKPWRKRQFKEQLIAELKFKILFSRSFKNINVNI